MRTLKDYLDAAKERTGATSDRKLALVLGIAPTTLFHLQRQRNWPSDELMIRLAMVAGIDPQTAVLDLCIWRSEQGLARSTYIEIARRLGKSAAAIFCAGLIGAIALALAPAPARAAAIFAGGTQVAQVHIETQPNVYYGKSRRRRWRQFLPSAKWPSHLGKVLTRQALCRAAMRLAQALMSRDTPVTPGVPQSTSCGIQMRTAFLPSLTFRTYSWG